MKKTIKRKTGPVSRPKTFGLQMGKTQKTMKKLEKESSGERTLFKTKDRPN
jgi:hypothetical protein